LGAALRSPSDGPERLLVESFLRQGSVVPIQASQRATVFEEPRLESGFPDLVLVIWRPDVAAEWPKERKALTVQDLKVAHYLWNAGPQSLASTESTLQKPDLAQSFIRLLSAGIVRLLGRNTYALRSKSKIFAIDRLIAIEAKVGKWRSAVRQAILNSWFASESYILLAGISNTAVVTEAAMNFGVGVWVQRQHTAELLGSPPSVLPRSYGSWLFNEWVWRASFS
jgi:hypothetical protein